ncbi:aegerolysin type hemolysin [Hygrophoropsis aurantiaca]|uniref:Aegerolysin type hemolysin n=2 Tax=Hygrophoropsis aurantiaca TaxID=72124 RepID=A0ACB7ZQG6_9AGAM|nr:aegerolysin type hemolysin [Hygrophoropsis aurantiaca]KAH7903671.1 aegerolysin type hemolysin [Hygrophoropsis aurantiaca]
MSDSVYGLSVVLDITNSLGSRPIKIQNATILWGKFHRKGDPMYELSPEEIDKIVIPAGSDQSVSSIGRTGAASGVEGTIDLYDDTTKICTLYWNYPWAGPTDSFEIRDVNKAYNVTHGPLGPGQRNISIDVAIKE